MIIQTQTLWRGGRVVECGRLEICFRVTPNVGSNPTLSVELIIYSLAVAGFGPVTKFRQEKSTLIVKSKSFSNLP